MHRHHKHLLALTVVTVGLVASAAESIPICLRDSTELRDWQTYACAPSGLKWRWTDGATSASVVLTSLEDSTIVLSSGTIPKVTGDGYGTWVPPFDLTVESYWSARLSILSGSDEIESREIRLAVLPGAADNGIGVEDGRDSAWKRVGVTGSGRHVIMAWDDAWAGYAAETASLKLRSRTAGSETITGLPATSGYLLLDKTLLGESADRFDAILAFDGVNTWTTVLKYGLLGFCLQIK